MHSRTLRATAVAALACAILLQGCDGAEEPAAAAPSPSALASALKDAVAAHDAELARSLLADGADPDAASVDGTTVLVSAVYARDHDVMTALLDAGADPRRTNRYGADAMYAATLNGDAAAVRALLDHGADPAAALPEGQTALMTAARAGDAETLRALLEAGGSYVDVNAQEGWLGQTALMWAAAGGHADAMRVLIAAGADVNRQSSLIPTPPIEGGRSMGVSFSQLPKGRLSALHFAAREGQLEAVRVLIESGANLDIVDEYESTPLILAIVNGHLDAAGALLEAGADPRIADEWGRTAIFVATDLNTRDVLAYAQPLRNDALTAADIVRMALARGADPNAALTKRLPNWIVVGGDHSPILRPGSTTLLRAAMSGDLTIMRLLLDAGADPKLATEELPDGGEGGGGGMGDFGSGATTPFLAAAGLGWRKGVSRGREEDAVAALELLMGLGAGVNDVNQAGDTALHAATYRGSLLVMQFLLDQGADPTIANKTGWLPLDIALGQPDPAYRISPDPAAAELLRAHMAPS